MPDIDIRKEFDVGLLRLAKCGNKPQGILIELADFAIRTLDYFESSGKDIIQFKPFGEGAISQQEKDNFCEFFARLHKYIHSNDLSLAVDYIIRFCNSFNLDLESAIKLKMEYNKTRDYRWEGKNC